MSRRKIVSKEFDFEEIPETLDEHIFYGLMLNPEQKIFRDAIWNKDNDIIFCNAKAGTGKSLIAVATANLLVQYGLYKGITYIVSTVQEERIGYLPGDIADKISPYKGPLVDALEKININPDTSISSIENLKQGTSYIDFISHTYLRGCNLEDKVIIIDEAQNFYGDELKKTLTRICSNSKVIVIGHTGQCDLYNRPDHSGFAKYIEHFKDKDRCQICELTENYRGWVSNWADELEF